MQNWSWKFRNPTMTFQVLEELVGTSKSHHLIIQGEGSIREVYLSRKAVQVSRYVDSDGRKVIEAFVPEWLAKKTGLSDG